MKNYFSRANIFLLAAIVIIIACFLATGVLVQLLLHTILSFIFLFSVYYGDISRIYKRFISLSVLVIILELTHLVTASAFAVSDAWVKALTDTVCNTLMYVLLSTTSITCRIISKRYHPVKKAENS